MNIQTFYFNVFRECTYIISPMESAEIAQPCLIIDPGCYDTKEEQRLSDYLTSHHLMPEAILITHAHPDHVCGLDFVQGLFPAAKVIDKNHRDTAIEQKWQFRIIETPGHKEDCICIYFESEGLLFSGDTLFQESIGRTDLPGGDMHELVQSLATLKQLPDETKVYPGHGYTTTIGYEKQYNPYM